MKKFLFLLVIPFAIILSGCKRDTEIIDIEYLNYQTINSDVSVDEIIFLDHQYAMMRNYDRLYFSDDGGATWTNESDFGSYDIAAFCYTSIDTAYAFVNLTQSGNRFLHRTIDRGATWTQLTPQFDDYAAPFFMTSSRGIVISAPTSNTYVLNRTINSGQSWAQSYASPALYRLFVDNTTYFGITAGGGSFFKSSDAGQTWTATSGSAHVINYAMLPSEQRGFFLTRDGQIFSSTDFGSTWSVSLEDPAGAYVEFIKAHPSGLVVAAGRGAVLISEDFGATWSYRSFYNEPLMSEYIFYTLNILDANTIILCGRNPDHDYQIFKVTLP